MFVLLQTHEDINPQGGYASKCKKACLNPALHPGAPDTTAACFREQQDNHTAQGLVKYVVPSPWDYCTSVCTKVTRHVPSLTILFLSCAIQPSLRLGMLGKIGHTLSKCSGCARWTCGASHTILKNNIKS